MSLIERALRACLTGSITPLTFYKPLEVKPVFDEPTRLYLHVPLCKNCCPFCPYVREPYTNKKADLLFKSIKKEIDIFSNTCKNLKTTSLYIIGGSPLSLGSRLYELVACFTENLNFKGAIAIELYPDDVNSASIEILDSCRTTMVSLGVQSFDDKILNHIQRKHSSAAAKTALAELSKKPFDSLNVDLLFAIEGQTWSSVENDLQYARDLGATQITCYPLFTFPFNRGTRALLKVTPPPLRSRARGTCTFMVPAVVVKFRSRLYPLRTIAADPSAFLRWA